MTDPILEFNGLTKSFKTKTVLKDINLAVERGRVVGVLVTSSKRITQSSPPFCLDRS